MAVYDNKEIEKSMEKLREMEIKLQKEDKRSRKIAALKEQVAPIVADLLLSSDEEEEETKEEEDVENEQWLEEEPDSDEWELVDEDHVVVELVGLVNKDTFKDVDRSKVKFVGLLDSDRPVLQIGDQVFVGKREDVHGTAVIMKISDGGGCSSDEDEPVVGTSDSQQNPSNRKKLEVSYLTTKKLVMHQAFLSSKKDSAESGTAENSKESPPKSDA